MNKYQVLTVSQQFYIDFPDKRVMRNKIGENGAIHYRPYFLAFPVSKNSWLYWLIPISSQVDKYKEISKKKRKKYKEDLSIVFGNFQGSEHVFLIQNMMPVSSEYLAPYIDSIGNAVYIEATLAESIIEKAERALIIQRDLEKKSATFRIIYPDIFKILKALKEKYE